MKRLAICALVALGCAFAQPARSDVMTLAPVQAVVLAPAADGSSRVALLFDLGGLPQVNGWRLDSALLTWAPDGIPTDGPSSYAMAPIVAAWTLGVNGGTEVVPATEPADVCDIVPDGAIPSSSPRIRFEATALVDGWLSAPANNHGVVISLTGINPGHLAEDLAGVSLKILYGFRN